MSELSEVTPEEVRDDLATFKEPQPEKFSDMPIVFLAPKAFEGKLGFQRHNSAMEVVAVILEDGTNMTQHGCSYRGRNA